LPTPRQEPRGDLIASGSEVSLAVQAHEQLVRRGHPLETGLNAVLGARSTTRRENIGKVKLPPQVKARVAVEQASTFGWERYVGLEGRIIGMKTFGASAPLKELRNVWV
jgi:transketolase